MAEEAEESSEVGGWEVEIRLAIVTPDLGTTGVRSSLYNREQWTGDLVTAEKLLINIIITRTAHLSDTAEAGLVWAVLGLARDWSSL